MQKTQSHWSKLPIAWIRYSDKLREFRVKDIGSSISALKIYIALVLRTDYKTGNVSITYDQLEDLTDMARATVSNGLKKLKSVGLIENIGLSQSTYHLAYYEDERGFGKLPKNHLYNIEKDRTVLCEFSTRNRAHLNALKIYLLLVTFRDKNSNNALLSYTKITEYSGMSREFIRSGLSVLYELHLINREPHEKYPDGKNMPNKYQIIGL